MYGYLFFKKTCFNLWTLNVWLSIFKKSLFESQDLRELICISLDLTKKLEQFLRPLGPYMYGYFFEKIVSISGPSGPHMYLSRSY